MLVASIHAHLLHEREGDAVARGAEGLDLLSIARFPVQELVAGEAEQGGALIGVSPLQRFELLVLRCPAAARGHIDHEHRAVAVGHE